jgi:hypothetical protein
VRDKRLVAIHTDKNMGRWVQMIFGDAQGPTLDLVLIPAALNVLAQAHGKKIALEKPKNIQAQHHPTDGTPRTPLELREQWLATTGKTAAATPPSDPREHRIAKLTAAIAKVQNDLAKKTPQIYRKLGEHLVANQSLDVPSEWQGLIDPAKSLAQNVEQAFQKAKDLEQKIARTAERLEELKKQRDSLVQGAALPASAAPKPRVQTAKDKKAHYRTLPLSENMEFKVGKSAADNLALLRASRSWDLWMHVKDRPGSHGILFRNKNQKVSDQELHKAAQFLLQTGAKDKVVVALEVVVTECRFVRPIKGDRLGQVTYHNARTLRVQP